MNRTERAIKKKCRLAMKAKKAEKHRAIAEMRDYIGFDSGYCETVTEIAKEEKGLREWHRKTLNDYTSRKTTSEVATA